MTFNFHNFFLYINNCVCSSPVNMMKTRPWTGWIMGACSSLMTGKSCFYVQMTVAWHMANNLLDYLIYYLIRLLYIIYNVYNVPGRPGTEASAQRNSGQQAHPKSQLPAGRPQHYTIRNWKTTFILNVFSVANDNLLLRFE